ncbi:MAG TPA: ABC transporter permease [Pinirhizobacter sp.]|uniref:ABC transporter permease n=1 Tax=Pinirhizobacter sp. TaxID=2950432 RepID=UPI002CA12DAE|nr:ABC transporter permease [Pinirhizobacter sp.]HMH67769.1 ABC transporter permease [Pinirhizobacter sp.]
MLGYYFFLALRSLRRTRMLTALMVLAIAVGIGASMTTLSVMFLLSGDPLPGKSDKLFYPQLEPSTGATLRHWPMDLMDYASAHDLWAAHRATRQAMVAEASTHVVPTASGQSPFTVATLATTSDFFPMFDVPFKYGGPWTPEDEGRAARQVVLSATLNQRLFGGANSVGQDVVINGAQLRVVGVLDHWRPRPRFYMLAGSRNSGGDTGDFYGPTEDIFLPMATGIDIAQADMQPFTCWSNGNIDFKHMMTQPCAWVGLWVELPTAAARDGFSRFLDDYDAQQRSIGRFPHPKLTRMLSLHEWLAFQQVIPADVKLQTWLAFAFLAICLFNTVGLLLAKFIGRSNEIGVRRALGASRGAIFGQCLVEAGLIGSIGGLFGLLFTVLGVVAIRHQPVAYADLVSVNIPLFLLALAVALGASIVAGIFPAFRASRVAPALQLKVQ